MAQSNSWKLQDAKARFSEVVRRARDGEPQQVTVHGKEAVLVVDPQRFEVRPKKATPRTMADFIKASKPFRGVADGVDFERPLGMHFNPTRGAFEEDKP